MEQNEKDIMYLKQNGQLLKETIEMRVSAYFKPDSNIIVDDEQLQMSYCKTLSNGAKVLINVVETVCQFQNRGWLNKMLKAGAGVDVTSSERSLDFAIKSIIALDPIQKTFNMNSIMPHFKSQEALHFWKFHRFRYCTQGDRLCEAVIKKAIRVNEALEQPGTAAILQVELFKRLNAESTGFINSIDFGERYSEENLSALVTSVIYFGAEIESQLNDRIPETREWLLDSIIKRKASIILLVAGPGFRKSIISAWGASNWKCIHYFFKVDDARMRTALNFFKKLLLQLHDKLRKTRIQEAVALESRIHESLDFFLIALEAMLTIWAGSLSMLLTNVCTAIKVLFEEIGRTDATLKILVTSRPNAAAQPAPKFPHPHQRIDCGLSLDETVFEPSFEILSDLESRPENFEDVRIYFESTLRLATGRGITILTTESKGNFLRFRKHEDEFSWAVGRRQVAIDIINKKFKALDHSKQKAIGRWNDVFARNHDLESSIIRSLIGKAKSVRGTITDEILVECARWLSNIYDGDLHGKPYHFEGSNTLATLYVEKVEKGTAHVTVRGTDNSNLKNWETNFDIDQTVVDDCEIHSGYLQISTHLIEIEKVLIETNVETVIFT
ncbi:hypothetical protein HDU77_006313, partial [Chytriomyces hyalinus]